MEDQFGPDCLPFQEDSLVLPFAETPAAAAPVHDAVVHEPREHSVVVIPESHGDTVPAQGVRHIRFRCKTSVAADSPLYVRPSPTGILKRPAPEAESGNDPDWWVQMKSPAQVKLSPTG